MGKKKFKIIKIEGTPEWMISFGDLMSCLLVFFILLLTFSSATPGKVMDMMSTFQEGFDAEPGDLQDGNVPGGGGEAEQIEVASENEAPMKLTNLLIAQKYGEYQEMLYKMGFKNKISVNQVDDGLLFEVKTSDIFTKDNVLSSNSQIFLQSIGNAILSLKKECRIISVVRAGENSSVSTLIWSSEQQIIQIKNLFTQKYKISPMLISTGMLFKEETENVTRFLMAEKTESKIESLKDFIDGNKTVREPN